MTQQNTPLQDMSDTQLEEAAARRAAARAKAGNAAHYATGFAAIAALVCMVAFSAPLAVPALVIGGLAAGAIVAGGFAVKSHMDGLQAEAGVYTAEAQERKKNPFARLRALSEAFDAAISGGVKKDIAVKKPLQLKSKGVTP